MGRMIRRAVVVMILVSMGFVAGQRLATGPGVAQAQGKRVYKVVANTAQNQDYAGLETLINKHAADGWTLQHHSDVRLIFYK